MRTMLRSKVTLLFIVVAALVAIPAMAFALGSPTIQSDKADYSPGELVTLSGSGWQAGESVHIVVNDDEGQTWSHTADVTADGSGSISDSFNLPDWFVATYTVTATGSSGTATTSFTDGQVRVQAVGTAGANPTINWTRYSSTDCTGTVVDSGSFSAATTDPGTTIQTGPGNTGANMNLASSQSLQLTPGSVNAQHTFSSWSGGDFTTG